MSCPEIIIFEADSCSAIPITRENTVKEATAAVISISNWVNVTNITVSQTKTLVIEDMRLVLRDSPISFFSSKVAKTRGRLRSIALLVVIASMIITSIRMTDVKAFCKVAYCFKEYWNVKYRPTRITT